MQSPVRAAKTARQRLQEAERFFHWSIEPAIIDRAIAQMAEAEKLLGRRPPAAEAGRRGQAPDGRG